MASAVSGLDPPPPPSAAELRNVLGPLTLDLQLRIARSILASLPNIEPQSITRDITNRAITQLYTEVLSAAESVISKPKPNPFPRAANPSFQPKKTSEKRDKDPDSFIPQGQAISENLIRWFENEVKAAYKTPDSNSQSAKSTQKKYNEFLLKCDKCVGVLNKKVGTETSRQDSLHRVFHGIVDDVNQILPSGPQFIKRKLDEYNNFCSPQNYVKYNIALPLLIEDLSKFIPTISTDSLSNENKEKLSKLKEANDNIAKLVTQLNFSLSNAGKAKKVEDAKKAKKEESKDAQHPLSFPVKKSEFLPLERGIISLYTTISSYCVSLSPNRKSFPTLKTSFNDMIDRYQKTNQGKLFRFLILESIKYQNHFSTRRYASYIGYLTVATIYTSIGFFDGIQNTDNNPGTRINKRKNWLERTLGAAILFYFVWDMLVFFKTLIAFAILREWKKACGHTIV